MRGPINAIDFWLGTDLLNELWRSIKEKIYKIPHNSFQFSWWSNVPCSSNVDALIEPSLNHGLNPISGGYSTLYLLKLQHQQPLTFCISLENVLLITADCLCSCPCCLSLSLSVCQSSYLSVFVFLSLCYSDMAGFLAKVNQLLIKPSGEPE